MHVWNELTQCSGKKAGYGEMVGESIVEPTSSASSTVPATTLYIPLEFWFCRKNLRFKIIIKKIIISDIQ